MAAHLFWRVNFASTQTPGANPCDLGKCVLRDTPGGPSITIGAGGTASASSIFGGGYVAANAFGNNAGAFWAANAPAPQWLQYEFLAPVDIVELGLTSSPSNALGEAPATGNLEFSDDGAAWTQKFLWTVVPFTANSQTRTVDPVIVDTEEIDAPQAGAIVVFRQAAVSLFAPSGGAITIYNVPSEQINATYAGASVPYIQIARSIDVQQAGALAVSRGRVANPRLRSWTFTLDGHDFYVLRLGDEATLIYDTASEQWVDWASGDVPFWRLNCGMNWIGAQALGHTMGSAVIAGDDVHGVLWFLDPDQAWDQHPFAENPNQELPFERIVTGQVLAVGRASVPCYGIFLAGDNYGSDATEYVASVRLDYSDDQGRNFDSAESLLSDITTTNPYSWYSLGQIEAPGRIFRVVDNGVLTRIDSMSMNDDG